MTEFRCVAPYFKQDPIALRHCILYEFVQGKPVDTAYTEFCKKFPYYSVESRKVIEKEEFEYWFDQFKQGKFDDDKEPVTDMKEILRNDKRALRACILSEAHKLREQNESYPYNVRVYEPYDGFILTDIKEDFSKSLKKYMRFREVLGKDAMDYREFRFWMNRFYCSEFDLGYEGPINFVNFEAARVYFNKCDKYLETIDRLSDMFKDPIILRYCLLFEFLKHKPIEEVFENFCRKLGEKVMDSDTFQYWFNQFEQGIFDDKKEPVADMRDILRNDQRALRICILYVSLNYHSVNWSFTGLASIDNARILIARTPDRNNMPDRNFPIYSFFCDILGENVMEYREFIYWKMRFSNGKFDFDHERSEKALELIDMPIDVMKSIAPHLDIVDRAKLRRTSKAFRAFIDSQPLFLNEISFRPENSYGIDSWRIEMRSSNSKKTYSTIYTNNQQNDYHHRSDGESRWVDREYYQKCAMEHLKLIFKIPNLHSEHLRIETYGRLEDYKNLFGEVPIQNTLLDGLASVIDSSAKPCIKSISIKSAVLEPIVNFLSYLESGYLESISLDCEYTHGTGLSKMLELEQFKQAKELNVYSMPFAGSVRDLLHLDSFRVDMATFTAEDFRILREVAFKSSTFKNCRLRVEGEFDVDGVRRELEDSLTPGIQENTFRHLIPNTEDCFEIYIDASGISVSKIENYREKDRRQMEMNNRFRPIQM